MPRKLMSVKLEFIKDVEYQMRLAFDDCDFDELVESIKRHGVLVPVLLERKGDVFSVVAGHRRVAAASKAGLSEIPCNVLDSVDGQGWGYAFAENIFRKDLSAIELAGCVKDCLESDEWDEEKLARGIGRSVQWIRLYRSIAEWPADIQEAMHVGKISVSAARNLVMIDDEVQRRMLTDYAVENGATARITAAWLQSYQMTKAVADPGEVKPAAGRSVLPPIEPFTPCVICGQQFKMIELHYTPICTGCTEVVLSASREIAAGRG